MDRNLRPLALWGGIEGTVNRVGDRYFDQVARSGHDTRLDDLDRIADLGIRTLRYPVLWEWAAKNPFEMDWSWADERLPHLRSLGVEPIVGLVHHGSGPRHTSLIDDDFAPGLAEYAARVAERFPWVSCYTPVNEPLTTARFSGLYGLWFPHGRDPRTFVRALLNQCRAVVLSMRAIREVRSDARLIQTEDMGRTYSTPTLAYQADFENERRWLSFDLLCGRVGRLHPLWDYLTWAGATPHEIEWFAERPCPPDIVGINHYVTSERFLDDRLERYPCHTHGGNDRHAYADIEAVRVGVMDGPHGLLEEAWNRYGIPIAVTEVHLGCTREEQMRWVLEVWNAAHRARDCGADVRAVTVWSLLGAFDWDSLVTRETGSYEPGVFDLRGSTPRPTALAGLVRELAAGLEPTHPVLSAPGWWHRPECLGYPHAGDAFVRLTQANDPEACHRPILIVADDGPSGETFAESCRSRGLVYSLLPSEESTSPASLELAFAERNPWAAVDIRGKTRSPGLSRLCDDLRVRILTASYTNVSARIVGGLHRGALFVRWIASDDPQAIRAFVDACLDLLIDGESGHWRTTAGTMLEPMPEGKHSHPVGTAKVRRSAQRPARFR